MLNLPRHPLAVHVLGTTALCAATTAAALEPNANWVDSYSVDGQCYCDSSFDHGADELFVDTPQGPKNVQEVCALIGPGPGKDGHPLYNDLQCGHGPPNFAPLDDERLCPGRVDQGEAGCQTKGPRWDLDALYPGPEPEPEPVPEPEAPVGIDAAEADVALGALPAGSIAVEAEDDSARDDRWVRVAPTADSPYGPGGPGNADDADGPHLAGASAAAYLELLPDAQRVATDPAPDGGAWQAAGAGPRIAYELDFPVAGTWTVRARLHAAGGLDASFFVGIDGRFDAATGLVTACAAGEGWAWSVCDDGGAPGEDPVVRVDSPGIHTLEIAGRDDGVEIDRIALVAPADASGGDASDPAPVARPAPGPPASPGDPVPPTTPDTAAPSLGQAVTVGGGVAPGVAAFGGGTLLLPLLALLVRRRSAAGRFLDRS